MINYFKLLLCKFGVELQEYLLSKVKFLWLKELFKKIIDLSIKSKPVTLVAGARKVGKSTCVQQYIEKGEFIYISLDNIKERELAKKGPDLFLSLHPYPLIIDEAQYAFELLNAIEEKVSLE